MKDIFIDLGTNRVLLAAIFSWAASQGTKMILEIMKHGFDPKRLAGGGGMPSAHTATVMGLITATAIVYGFGGFEFPMALFFGIIVIYDARGVRYETGQQAKILNRLRQEREKADVKNPLFEEELDEHMGHTIPEIIVGGIVGLVVGLVVGLW